MFCHLVGSYCTNVQCVLLARTVLCTMVLLQAMWVPGSQTELVVVSDTFVKIYDLRVDLISPVYYFVILTGKIKDATVAVTGEVQVMYGSGRKWVHCVLGYRVEESRLVGYTLAVLWFSGQKPICPFEI